MERICVIQARMGSSRLPGKVLSPIEGASMLAHVVRRIKRARYVDQVVVATTVRSIDDAIEAECDQLGAACFRGNEHDVLDRYYEAARKFGAEIIIRVTSDCPLIDPDVFDRVVGTFESQRPDYCSNTVERTFPRGLDVEAFAMDTLARAWKESRRDYERVHVTPYLYRNPDKFRNIQVTDTTDRNLWRWTVDTADDLHFVREVYARLRSVPTFGWTDIIALVESDPSLPLLNQHIHQKVLEEC
jgi:spore coat polysaccharide biosynthesis protein SpsF